MSKITRVPRMFDYMLGIINLRGMVLPVIDTRMKFGLPITEYTIHTCILVLEVIIKNKVIQLGALVDGVQEVIDIECDKILPSPTFGNKFNPEFISGVYRKEDSTLIMLLDMDYIFSNEELMILQEVKEVKEFV
jgi:purine-binding chemotaxis protein CheW